MRIFFFSLLVTLPLLASNLLTYNIYERSDRVDIMLSFDAPYEGSIYQKKGANLISLTLNDLIFDQLVEKNINSDIVQELTIEPSKNSTIVTLKSEGDIGVLASKTVDGFGLRIRSKLISPKPNKQSVSTTPVFQSSDGQSVSPKSDPLPGSDIIDTRYITVIVFMVILLFVLLWVKRKLRHKTHPSNSQVPANWLFKNAASNDMMKVLYQKHLDGQNKVVLFDFEGKQYLVMTGTSNVLLDRFNSPSVQSDGEFQEVFEKNRQKLDDYLKLQHNQLSSYKEKVSQDYIPHQDHL